MSGFPSTLSVVIGAHAHLPEGSGEDEFEALYESRIKPVVSTLYKFPRISMAFHYSGALLYRIERRHPELFMLLEDILGRRQAELLGGGFYEPLLPLLSPADRLGQIEMLTTYLRKQFGKRPQGCYLADLVWEQSLVSPLAASGMLYTFLGEGRFAAAGARRGAAGLYAPCLTEDQGRLVTVFPVASREDFFERPFACLEELNREAGAGAGTEKRLLTIFPAFPSRSPLGGGEAERECRRFFEELSNAGPGVDFTLPGRLVKGLRGLEKLSFPGPGSREDNPRQILVDCPGANALYAKTVYTRGLVSQLRGDKARKRSAAEELYKAQDSRLYAAGGERNLRRAAFKALLEAERIVREEGRFTPSLAIFDFDLDGEGEYLFQDEQLNCYVTARGAGAFELDYLPRPWNYLDVLPSGAAGPGLRRAFTDILAPGGSEPAGEGAPGVRRCGEELFEAVETDRVRRRVVFHLPPRGGGLEGVALEKTWRTKKNVLAVRYVLRSAAPVDFFFMPRIDLSFPGAGEGFLRILALRGGSREPFDASPAGAGETEAGGLEFQDLRNEAVIALEADRPCRWRVTQVFSPLPAAPEAPGTPGGYEFTSIQPLVKISLGAGASWEGDFSLKISS